MSYCFKTWGDNQAHHFYYIHIIHYYFSNPLQLPMIIFLNALHYFLSLINSKNKVVHF